MTNNKYFFIGIGGIVMSSIDQYLYEKKNTILIYEDLRYLVKYQNNLNVLL